MATPFTVRPMRREEIGFAIDLADAEGWNPGLHDGAAFWAADPHGFLVAEHGGEPVGCVSAVSYAQRFGFIGLFIGAKAWRGQGVGSLLCEATPSRYDRIDQLPQLGPSPSVAGALAPAAGAMGAVRVEGGEGCPGTCGTVGGDMPAAPALIFCKL